MSALTKKGNLVFLPTLLLLLGSCSVSKKIERSAAATVLKAPVMATAHIGISVVDAASGKQLYDYQGDKYFVPASNTKIPTCYAAMKYLGDSLVGLKYGIPEDKGYKEKLIVIQPSGDPTFLHEDYKRQPVLDFMKAKFNRPETEIAIMDTAWRDRRWGSGWSWSDYEAAYMAERNAFPVYGNAITIKLNEVKDRQASDSDFMVRPLRLFGTGSPFFDSVVNNNRLQTMSRSQFRKPEQYREPTRSMERNSFDVENTTRPFSETKMTFATGGNSTTLAVLKNMFVKEIGYVHPAGKANSYQYDCPNCDIAHVQISKWNTIHSQPTDSMLKPLMHRSDNFFAEQSLLMVSNQKLGIMSDARIIDTLLKTDLADLPQKPRWVDGSGLSRYNLFTPRDFVAILGKMRNEFGMERIKTIFPTGGTGTLESYYKEESGYIFAKTGTLSGVVALSGYLYTKKGKLLLFSVLVNNHQGSATDVRKAIESFLRQIRQQY